MIPVLYFLVNFWNAQSYDSPLAAVSSAFCYLWNNRSPMLLVQHLYNATFGVSLAALKRRQSR